MAPTTLFLSAGDPSGDNAAGRLAAALKKHLPDLDLFGLGGEKLRYHGQHQLADSSDLAVLGFWEVARRFRFFQRLLARCADEIKRRRPAAVILVDYPGFNLRLAKKIKPLGIPVIYYISPQVWAWGQRRVGTIKNLVDLMLVILPFEVEFYRRHGMEAHFVGHYLLDDIPQQYQRSPLPTRQPSSLCLLPGSRPQEIERILPPMLETARRFNRLYGTRAVIAGMKGRFDYEPLVRDYAGDDIMVSFEDSRRIIYESSLVLTASGTATLETAVIGRPMVVVYKTGFVTYQIARRLIRLDNIALVNLVLNERVVPELIQHQVTPENILPLLSRCYEDRPYVQRVKARLDTVPDLLGGTGASERAAQLIAECLRRV
jgi:lipid-A-disaccharide synthase